MYTIRCKCHVVCDHSVSLEHQTQAVFKHVPEGIWWSLIAREGALVRVICILLSGCDQHDHNDWK